MNPIEQHLSTYSNLKTRRLHGYHLKTFFNFIGKNPDTYFNDKTSIEQYLNDFKSFYHYLRNKNYMYHSIRVKISTIRVFFKDNGINISDSIINELKGRSRPTFDVTRDYVPTKKEMRKILSFADVKQRALFLTAISSGMRIGEIIQLLPEDIDWSQNPVKITINGKISKNGNSRITFISNEAENALKAWMSIRDSYLETAVKRCNNNPGIIYNKNPNDRRIFPYSYVVPYKWWRKLIRLSGFDERDSISGHFKTHIHCLRKFFRSNLPNGGASIDVVEELMGHTGYLTNSYRRIDEGELAKQFNKAMHKVEIFNTFDEITEEENKIEAEVQKRLKLKENQLEQRLLNKLLSAFKELTPEQRKQFNLDVTPEDMVKEQRSP